MAQTLKFEGMRWTKNENIMHQHDFMRDGKLKSSLGLSIHNVTSLSIEERMVKGVRVLTINAHDSKGNISDVSFHIKDEALIVRSSDELNYEWQNPVRF